MWRTFHDQSQGRLTRTYRRPATVQSSHRRQVLHQLALARPSQQAQLLLGPDRDAVTSQECCRYPLTRLQSSGVCPVIDAVASA